MWMTDYIREVKRQLKEVYGFQPRQEIHGDPKHFAPGASDIIFGDGQIPDGVYPMVIEGQVDWVDITNDHIHCCHMSTGITKEDDKRTWKLVFTHRKDVYRFLSERKLRKYAEQHGYTIQRGGLSATDRAFYTVRGRV